MGTQLTRPEAALQYYLDGLLKMPSEPEAESVSASQEPQLVLASVASLPATPAILLAEKPVPVTPLADLISTVPEAILETVTLESAVLKTVVLETGVQTQPAIVVETQPPPFPPLVETGRPDWAGQPFESLLFDVCGLTLAVPLISLGGIYPLAEEELTPLFGQPSWFLGIMPSQTGNLKVVDTALIVMPERYRRDYLEEVRYIISIEGYDWGLVVNHVQKSVLLSPDDVKWRSHHGKRPWLAGTVVNHMCALLDVQQLARHIVPDDTHDQDGSAAGAGH